MPVKYGYVFARCRRYDGRKILNNELHYARHKSYERLTNHEARHCNHDQTP